jgi:hypothetical protein
VEGYVSPVISNRSIGFAALSKTPVFKEAEAFSKRMNATSPPKSPDEMIELLGPHAELLDSAEKAKGAKGATDMTTIGFVSLMQVTVRVLDQWPRSCKTYATSNWYARRFELFRKRYV